MEKEQLLLLLENCYTKLSPQGKYNISLCKGKYPYCTLFQLLDLTVHPSMELPSWHNLLLRTVIYMPDRAYLREQINIFKQGKRASYQQSSIKVENIIKKEISNSEIIVSNENPDLKTKSSVDILSEINAYEEITLKTASKKELIEKFLEIQSPKIQKPASFAQESVIQEQKNPDESLTFASETLAILHEKQGNFNRAIKIYELLILKYPEKSTIFASQIEQLKKLIK